MGRIPRLLAGVIAVALVPSVAAAQTTELSGQPEDTRDERGRVEQRLGEVRAAEGDARARLAAVEGELGSAETALAQLEVEVTAAEAQLAVSEERANDSRRRLAQVSRALERAEAQLTDKQDRLDARVRAAFKYGQVSFAHAFAGVRDIADFLNSTTYVARVLDGDKELVDDVSTLLGGIEGQRVQAQALRVDSEREAAAATAAAREVERAAVEQQRLTDLVRERKAERETVFEQLKEDRAAIEGHLAGLEAESSRIQAQLADIARQQAANHRRDEEDARRAEQARLDREAAERCDAAKPNRNDDDPEVVEACGPPERAPEQIGGTTSAGGWTRPVGGGLTSSFGPRWGRNHNGVDLTGSIGTTVVAARSGTVVHVSNGCHPTSSWSCGGGFGNYITVTHDAGLATIYAHMFSVAVGSGQQVAAGQAVGAVGNSGNSYGPHLHFEVRDGGVPRNPCGYIDC